MFGLRALHGHAHGPVLRHSLSAHDGGCQHANHHPAGSPSSYADRRRANATLLYDSLHERDPNGRGTVTLHSYGTSMRAHRARYAASALPAACSGCTQRRPLCLTCSPAGCSDRCRICSLACVYDQRHPCRGSLRCVRRDACRLVYECNAATVGRVVAGWLAQVQRPGNGCAILL